MKVNQTTNICPRLKPVQLPLVGKWVSINSATRIFKRKAMMTGISSVRSWVMVMCSLIPRAYLNSYFLAKIRTNCEIISITHTTISHVDFRDYDTIYAPSTLDVYERTRWTLIAPYHGYILEHCLCFRDYSIESCSNRFSHSRSSST